jgi:hypothetical protein
MILTIVKKNYTFSRKFNMLAQKTESYDTYDTDEKDKTMSTGIAVNKSSKISSFSYLR